MSEWIQLTPVRWKLADNGNCLGIVAKKQDEETWCAYVGNDMVGEYPSVDEAKSALEQSV